MAKEIKQEEKEEQEKEELNIISKEGNKVIGEKITIKRIDVISDKNGEFVTQIRFNLINDDVITFSPKERIETTEKLRGLNIVKRENKSIKVEDIPEDLYKYNDYINENGKINLIMDYRLFNTEDKEGNPIIRKFIYDSDFLSSYAVDKNNKQIEL